ncbi:MAG: hypothetical protein CR986_07905 [Ignavibacteriae bacterium]|nr:MAG: hypothetical protein CR986_07905 [Ignavibacteriota bacterium]
MKKILLTIDTEFIISKNEILGIKGSNGIDDILAILEKENVAATFFIDYYEMKKWGEEIFSEITEKIKNTGHQIELHLHPDTIKKGRPHLHQYSKEEQKLLIEESIELFERFNNRKPKFFRAGSYSANDATLEILSEKNFIADLSFQHKQKRCKISKNKFDKINQVGFVENLTEIPTSVYKYKFFTTRYNSINLEWCSLSELKEITEQIKKSELDYFVVMMHSFSFLNRWDRKRLTKNNQQKKKFVNFIRYAKQSGYEFQTVSEFLKETENKTINTTSDFLPEVKKMLPILTGAFAKLRGKFILNKKFRRIFLISSILSFIFFLFLLYILFFNLFSPGYREMENVNVNVTSWNADNDITTIESYFIELKDYKIKTKNFKDENGILFRKPYSDTVKYKMKKGVEKLYIPTDMSGTIIRDYTKLFLTKDSSLIEDINLNANWLLQNVKIENNCAMWEHPYIFTKYDLDYGWCGAWALGNILSAISRKIQLAPNDTNFIQLSEKILNSFQTKIEEGGILYIDKNQNYWYEEYPAIPPNHVLNGHINGVLGLFDYWRITGNKRAKFLFDKGVETTLNYLENFDSGFWSFYDLEYPYITDYFYHKGVHIPQLKILWQLTQNETFKTYYKKWEKYLDEPYYTFYKLKMIYDGFHRRFTYKSFFTLGK